jgi:carbon storage regulator
MFIMTRSIGQTLMVGEDVTVRVLAVRGDRVRVAVNAPGNVPVYRDEVLKELSAAAKAALAPPAGGLG